MEKFVEEAPMRGVFEMKVFKDEKLIDKILEENLIVNGARQQMARLIAGEGNGRTIAKIAFGTSGTEPTPADTAIANQWAKTISGHSYPESGRVQFDWELLVTENNGMAILELIGNCWLLKITAWRSLSLAY